MLNIILLSAPLFIAVLLSMVTLWVARWNRLVEESEVQDQLDRIASLTVSIDTTAPGSYWGYLQRRRRDIEWNARMAALRSGIAALGASIDRMEKARTAKVIPFAK